MLEIPAAVGQETVLLELNVIVQMAQERPHRHASVAVAELKFSLLSAGRRGHDRSASRETLYAASIAELPPVAVRSDRRPLLLRALALLHHGVRDARPDRPRRFEATRG